MTTIDNINGSQSLAASEALARSSEILQSVVNERTSLPKAKETLDSLLAGMGDDLPALTLSQRGISIDTILQAIQDEARRNGVQSAVDRLETTGAAADAENLKQLEELQKQVEANSKKSFWDKLGNVFKWIGLAVAAVATAATAVAAVATGNGFLIAAAVMGTIALADSIVSAANDGKGIWTSIAKACGASDKTANWVSFSINMFLAVGSIACGITGAVKVAGNVVEQASKLTTIATKLSSFSQIASGANGIAGGVTTGMSGYYDNKIQKSKANVVDIEAILETLRNNQKDIEELIKLEMECADNLMSSVKDIVDDCSNAATKIMTANPSVA